jgi:hypothetical protein
MQQALVSGDASDQDNCPRRQPPSQLTYDVEPLGRRHDAPHPVRLSFDATVVYAVIYSVAGLIFGIVATVLLFACSRIQFLPLRTACVAWTYALPIVLTLNILWGSHRRTQLAVVSLYVGVLALFCLWSTFTDSAPSSIATVTFPAFVNPILLWAIFAAPSIVDPWLWLFLNRTVRAVGPVLLIFGSLVFLGWAIATVFLATSAGIQTAQWVFAATPIGAKTLQLGVSGAGLVVGVVLGWLVIGKVADGYAARRFSEQMLIIDSIWFLQTLMPVLQSSVRSGPLGGGRLGRLCGLRDHDRRRISCLLSQARTASAAPLAAARLRV